MNKVHLIDCLDFMADVPDDYYELAIVDPPYGIDITNQNQGKGGGVAKKIEYRNSNFDKKIPEKKYFNELIRVSRNQIVWGGNYFDLPKSKGWIIWKKMDIKNDFNPLEMAWTSNLKMGFFEFLWCGMWQENMKHKESRIHPTQKPVALYKWLLKNYANPGDKIFDSHVGSGSIRIACHDMGFDFEGCEIDEDYWKAQEQRYKNHIAQSELFTFEGGEVKE